MARPTINDLAVAAGVSVSTVNRVIGGGSGVRAATMLRMASSTPSNAALVAKARRVVEDLGGQIATPAEARALLGLPGRRPVD